MLDFNISEYCYGCGACGAVCPKNAISMVAGDEGFPVPKIDEEKCIKCGLCDKTCIYQHVLPVQAPDKIILSECRMVQLNTDSIMNSSSGGAFYGIAAEALKQGYQVCGCVWNEELEANHILTNTIDGVRQMQGSKYVQSNLGCCYEKIKKELDAGNKVLFSGTPCQIAGLKKIVGHNESLFTVGLICEGTPSPMVLKRWIKYMEKKHKSRIIKLYMRKKGRYGWKTPVIEYCYENGKKTEQLAFHLDLYIRNFICGLFMRNSCFNCQYKGDFIPADIIIGDCWSASYKEIQASKNKGLSAVILKTKKGKDFYKCIHHIFTDNILDKEIIITKNGPLTKPIKRNPNRNLFYEYISDHDLIDGIKKYGHYRTKKMILYWFLYHLHLFGVAKKMAKK